MMQVSRIIKLVILFLTLRICHHRLIQLDAVRTFSTFRLGPANPVEEEATNKSVMSKVVKDVKSR